MGRKNLIGVVVLGAGILVFPMLVTGDYPRSILVFIGIHALAAIGLALLLAYAGQISLGQNAFLGIGAYSSGILTVKLGLNPWLAMQMGIVLAAVVAYGIGRPSLRLKGHYLAMATLGFGWLAHIFFNEQSELTGGPSGLTGIEPLSLFGMTLDTDLRYYLLVWTIVLICLVMALNITQSRVGRALRAIGDQELAAISLGIDTAKYKTQIFMLSAVYASIAGSLYAHYLWFISPSDVRIFVSIKLAVMVVLGGMTLWGALIGAAVLTILPEVLTVFADYDVLVFGVLLVGWMVLMPRGVGPKLSWLGRAVHDRLQPRDC